MKTPILTIVLLAATLTAHATSLNCAPQDQTKSAIVIVDKNEPVDPYSNKYHVSVGQTQYVGYGFVDDIHLGLNLYTETDQGEDFAGIISGLPNGNGTYVMNFHLQAQSSPDAYTCQP